MSDTSGYSLTPVDGDPFAPTLTPVDHDPFLPSPSPNDTISAYTPSWSERIGNAVQDTLAGWGMSRGNSQDYGQSARTAAGLVPVLGNALAANQAVRDYQGGNYVGAGLNALATIPIPGAGIAENAVEGAVERGTEQALPGIIAYHGSPHSFDQFSSSAIGTGEGAQAYGHGLYFAGNEGVAKSYRDQLSPHGLDVYLNGEQHPLLSAGSGGVLRDEVNGIVPGDAPTWIKNSVVGAIRDAAEWGNGLPNQYALKAAAYKRAVGDASFSDDVTAKIRGAINDSVDAMGNVEFRPRGSMYQVSIAANPDHFLDWDKPLSEQSEHVRDQFNWAWNEAVQNVRDKRAAAGIEHPEAYNPTMPENAGEAMDRLGKISSHAEASTALKDLGIPGIKYLDAGSRVAPTQIEAMKTALSRAEARGDAGVAANLRTQLEAAQNGTHNYVVFDDKTINILKKYGIAGLGMTGAGAMAVGQQEKPNSYTLTPISGDPFATGGT